MEFNALEGLFWDAVAAILGEDFNSDNIRFAYPKDGNPGWRIDEDIIFIRLFEKEDDYARQINSTYHAERGTVIKKSSRTRVWDVQFTAYGPRGCENINKIKDGVFRQDVKKILSDGGVFLIPNLPPCRRVPELFAGQWWTRWDMTLSFNELYRLPDEDVGRVESVSIRTNYNR